MDSNRAPEVVKTTISGFLASVVSEYQDVHRILSLRVELLDQNELPKKDDAMSVIIRFKKQWSGIYDKTISIQRLPLSRSITMKRGPLLLLHPA